MATTRGRVKRGFARRFPAFAKDPGTCRVVLLHGEDAGLIRDRAEALVRSVAGSLIGGIRETQEMLDFCAAHGIGAEIELIGADQIDSAYDRVVASDVRYRFVIDTATF